MSIDAHLVSWVHILRSTAIDVLELIELETTESDPEQPVC